jgi:hypothetical protein
MFGALYAHHQEGELYGHLLRVTIPDAASMQFLLMMII